MQVCLFNNYVKFVSTVIQKFSGIMLTHEPKSVKIVSCIVFIKF